MDKLDPTMDDIKEKFADEPEYNGNSAGSTCPSIRLKGLLLL